MFRERRHQFTTVRVSRNPTVKSEIQMPGFVDEGLSVGFYIYPISQAADITAFDTTVIPVGEDMKNEIACWLYQPVQMSLPGIGINLS